MGCGYQRTGSLISELVKIGAIGMGKKWNLLWKNQMEFTVPCIIVNLLSTNDSK